MFKTKGGGVKGFLNNVKKKLQIWRRLAPLRQLNCTRHLNTSHSSLKWVTKDYQAPSCKINEGRRLSFVQWLSSLNPVALRLIFRNYNHSVGFDNANVHHTLL